MKDAATTTASGSFLFFPVWVEWIPQAWQLGITVLAGVVLVLTVWNKWLEIQLKSHQIEQNEKEDEDEDDS